MFINLTPLKKHRDFRWLYVGQTISFFGSMITVVALPYQIYHLTHSTLLVGLLSIVELVPLLITGLYGGVLADRLDRRKLLLYSEIALCFCCVLLILNVLLNKQYEAAVLFVLAGTMSAVTGFHRPALDGMTPRMVPKEDLPNVSSLLALKMNIALIFGPMTAGLLIAHFGLVATFSVDLFTFIISLFAIYSINAIPPLQQVEHSNVIQSIKDGMHYAVSHQELLGTYLVDIAAMIFGMPNALFPAIAEHFGGAKALGLLYSAPSLGALLISFVSGWTKHIKRQGAGVAIAAIVWGLGILLFGLMQNLWMALLFLAIAGAADTISVIFRFTIWNETIPDHFRGRLSGIQMLSYMSGPLLGNAEAGLVASLFTVTFSVVSGGAMCILSVIVCCFFLPKFWCYRSTNIVSTESQHKTE